MTAAEGRRELTEAALTLLREALVSRGTDARLVVRGSCMAPLLQDADTVVVRRLGEAPPPGSVVVGRSRSGAVVCHRVIGVSRRGTVVLCGDRSGPAEEVAADAVLGRVAAVERDGRRIDLAGAGWQGLGRVVAALRRRLAREARVRDGKARAPVRMACGAGAGLCRAVFRLRWALAGAAGRKAPQPRP